MQAELDNADDDALAYLACVLPCLETCGLRVVCVTVKGQWFASCDGAAISGASAIAKLLLAIRGAARNGRSSNLI